MEAASHICALRNSSICDPWFALPSDLILNMGDFTYADEHLADDPSGAITADPPLSTNQL